MFIGVHNIANSKEKAKCIIAYTNECYHNDIIFLFVRIFLISCNLSNKFNCALVHLNGFFVLASTTQWVAKYLKLVKAFW